MPGLPARPDALRPTEAAMIEDPVEGARPLRVCLNEMDLDLVDRCAARRQYRILRIAIYAPDGAQGDRFHGHYGLSREEAKGRIFDFYVDVAWMTYLGSK